MKLYDLVTDENWLMYAIKSYDNPSCSSVEEFNEDINRFKYLKRLFKRYHEHDDLKERLILNHIIVIYNMFGVEAGHKLTFCKIEKGYWPALKTFLIYLNFLEDAALPEIPIDQFVVDRLRKI